MNIPNQLSLARLVLTGVFILAVSLPSPFWTHTALIVFVVAAITDYLDGYLARKLNLVSSLGKLLDPLADKILTCSGFIFISVESASNPNISECPLWVTCLILGREFMVTGLRQIAVEQGQVIAADNLGKWKTTFQLIFQIGVLVQLSILTFGDTLPSILAPLDFITADAHYFIPAALWISLALTIISGWNYLWNGRHLLK